MTVSIFVIRRQNQTKGFIRRQRKRLGFLAQSGFYYQWRRAGVMRAATEGAHAGSGQAVGICFNPVGMTNFEGRDLKNRVDKLIETPDYVSRTLKLLELGNFYVVFNGGTGTISEFGMAWGLARLYFGNHKPMVLFGRFWEEIIEAFKKNMLLRPEEMRVYEIVETPEGAAEAIKRFAQGREK